MRQRLSRLPFLGLLRWSWLSLGDCRPAQAARYIRARIEHDGKVRLQAGFGVPDREPLAGIWRHLDGVSWTAVDELQPGQDNPNEVTLTGTVRIIIDNEIAVATVDRLRLVRAAGSQKSWQLPKDEVIRTREAAGLDLSARQDPGDWRWLVLAGVVGLLVMVGLIALCIKWWTRRPQD